MNLNFSIGLLVLIVLWLFMALAAFGALAVPALVFVVWLAVGIILVAVGR